LLDSGEQAVEAVNLRLRQLGVESLLVLVEENLVIKLNVVTCLSEL